MLRTDRNADELRPVNIIKNFTLSAPGSVLIECGRTRVLCSAMLDQAVPPFLKGSGKGWLTAEYGLLPSSTPSRKSRNLGKGIDGRGAEIQRLIGRSLRSAVDMTKLGETCIHIDCDVIEADGGTRTASITGAYIALCLAADKWLKNGEIAEPFIIRQVAAVSVGIVDGEALLDLCYTEDSSAEADMNIVMAGGAFVEIQVTGEGRPITRNELPELITLGEKGINRLMKEQRRVIGDIYERVIAE
jgi:ribonuclease PH